MEWLAFLEQEEWRDETRECHYLAQIAAEIARVREMFAESPKGVSVKDKLLSFERVRAGAPAATTPAARAGGIEMGPAALEDPHWARVNAEAKGVWAAMVGLGPLGG